MAFATKVGGKIYLNQADINGYVLAGVTGLMRVAGGALLTHGLATEATVDSAVTNYAGIITGFLLVVGGQAWAWYRENHKNSMIVQVGKAEAEDVILGPPPKPEVPAA